MATALEFVLAAVFFLDVLMWNRSLSTSVLLARDRAVAVDVV